jgi:microsomal epoxide hydrolase
MGLLKWIGILIVPVSIAAYFYCFICVPAPVKPDLVNGWWAVKDENVAEPRSALIEPFKVKASSDVMTNIKAKLKDVRLFESLPDSNFEYGMNSDYLKKVIKYWEERFDWPKQVAVLNTYPQFTTFIEGIEVHFVHVKPTKNIDKAVPLLLLHGWPGSFWEFYKIIPMLVDSVTLPADLNFELVIPSIPGYGFSEAPHRKGFDTVDAGRMFHKLMKRLGHDRYYVQGGDWGGLIAKAIAQIYERHVIGLHLNVVPPDLGSIRVPVRELIGEVFPSLIYTQEEMKTRRSFKEHLIAILRESGYMHLQATRPDTVAYGLNDSPAGLAAYIMEKFSVWCNYDNRFCADGCISKHFTLDELLTNVMIYWVTGNVVSSVRFYKENFANAQLNQLFDVPVQVATGYAAFPHEIIPTAESLARAAGLPNIIQYTIMPRGGHFGAMEEPKLLADDVIAFVQLVEKHDKPEE